MELQAVLQLFCKEIQLWQLMKQWIIVLQQFCTYTVKKCNWEDKNFRKVRNHCHSAGKSEQPAYIPVLAHNSSGNCKHWDCKSLNIVWNIKIAPPPPPPPPPKKTKNVRNMAVNGLKYVNLVKND